MDRLLGALATRALRRARAGEPLWAAVGVALWLVRRARRRQPDVVWSGRVCAGETLVVSTYDRGGPATADGA